MVTERAFVGTAFGGKDEQEIVFEPKHVLRAGRQHAERGLAALTTVEHVTRLLLELERVHDEAPRHGPLLFVRAERARAREVTRERVPSLEQLTIGGVRGGRERAPHLVRVAPAGLDLEPAARN